MFSNQLICYLPIKHFPFSGFPFSNTFSNQKVMIIISIQILSNIDISFIISKFCFLIFVVKVSMSHVQSNLFTLTICIISEIVCCWNSQSIRTWMFSQYFNMPVGGKKIIIASLMIISICLSAFYLISQCYILTLNNEKYGMERKIGLETIRNLEKSEDDKIEIRRPQSMNSIKNQVIRIISF